MERQRDAAAILISAVHSTFANAVVLRERERERKWKRLECPSHARSRGHNPGEGPAADILQNTYCEYHHSESNFNHVRYRMKPQEQYRGMQCFSSFSFLFFSLSLMEFCDFYTTWWYPVTYWEPCRLEDANSKEVIVSILGELSLTTALQYT